MTLTNAGYSTMITEGYAYKIGGLVLNETVGIALANIEFSYPSPQEMQLVFEVPEGITDVTTLAIVDYGGNILSLNNLFTTVVPNTFFKYKIRLDRGE